MKLPWKQRSSEVTGRDRTTAATDADGDGDGDQTIAADSNIVEAIREQAKAIRAESALSPPSRRPLDLATEPPVIDLADSDTSPRAAPTRSLRARDKYPTARSERQQSATPRTAPAAPAPTTRTAASLIDNQTAPTISQAWDPSGLTSFSPTAEGVASDRRGAATALSVRTVWKHRLLALVALLIVVAAAFALAWVIATRGNA